MGRQTRGWSVAGAALVALAPMAAPTVGSGATVGGGGLRKTDCLAVFETASADDESQRKIICEDGDPACDADGAANGTCLFDLSICINSSYSPSCTLSGVESIFVDHSADNGDPRFDPDFQALQDRIDSELDLPTASAECTAATQVSVPVDGPLPGNRCRSGKKKIRLTATSEFDIAAGRSYVDRDKMKLICRPAPGACDPQVLFTGTFDRIQRQIFDRNCAVSGCHDSQTFAGEMLLDSGASYGSLVGVTPVNFAASQLGWLRVNPGDVETSYLYQKLQGSFGPEFGERMPFGKGRLKRFLRDIVGLWILAGAPETGWVPGTD